MILKTQNWNFELYIEVGQWGRFKKEENYKISVE